jgi:hypothetical protein
MNLFKRIGKDGSADYEHSDIFAYGKGPLFTKGAGNCGKPVPILLTELGKKFALWNENSNSKKVFNKGNRRIPNTESMVLLINGYDTNSVAGGRLRDHSVKIKFEDNRNQISQIPRGEHIRISSKSLEKSFPIIGKKTASSKKLNSFEQIESRDTPDGFDDNHFVCPKDPNEISEREELMIDNSRAMSKSEIVKIITTEKNNSRYASPHRSKCEIDISSIRDDQFLKQ